MPFGYGYSPLLLLIEVHYTRQATKITTQNLHELRELRSSIYEVVEAFAFDEGFIARLLKRMNLVRIKLNIIASSGIRSACETLQHEALLITRMSITQRQILLVFTPKYTFIGSSKAASSMSKAGTRFLLFLIRVLRIVGNILRCDSIYLMISVITTI